MPQRLALLKVIVPLLKSIRRHWQLLIIMSWRDIMGRYRGSLMGLVWAFMTPLLLLLIYTFVFTVVFQVRWNIDTDQEGRATFAIILFVGMIIHGLLSEVLVRSPSLLVGHANYVKKVVFPLELLPLTLLFSAIFHFFISLCILFVAMLVLGHSFHLTMLWLPVTLLPLIPFLLGVAWGVSAIGVYLHDINHLTGLLSTVLLFLSPIFFPVEALGEPYKTLMLFNPLTLIIEQTRAVLLWGQVPDFFLLALYLLVSCTVAVAGYLLFDKARKGFADVL